MARHGASVLNPRSVEYAWKRNLDMRAKGTFADGAGTLITRDANLHGDAEVTGIAGHRALVRINTASDDASCEATAEILGDADTFLCVDCGSDRRDLYVCADDIADIKALGKQLDRDIEGTVHVETGLASASAVGLGVGACASTRGEIRKVMDSAGVGVRRLSGTRHALAAIISRQDRDVAMDALHRHFIMPAIASGKHKQAVA